MNVKLLTHAHKDQLTTGHVTKAAKSRMGQAPHTRTYRPTDDLTRI